MNKRKTKLPIKVIIISLLLTFLCPISSIEAKTFKVASYNLENLFDLTEDGTEYSEYVPDTSSGWDKNIVEIKLTNIAKVIKDLKADVIALQEVESEKALILLRNKLKELDVDYPYLEIGNSWSTSVECAILSKFPIINKKNIRVSYGPTRNILRVTLDIDGNHLILFINHWKSKQGPENLRIVYAKKLKAEINKLKNDVDFILIGDFNSNYNEYETFRNIRKLNNTLGATGINHILKTIKNSIPVDEKTLMEQTKNEYLYNLWLELNKSRRWSYNFFGNKNSPDSIIVSKGLYDNQGISYVDNSFDKFSPDYLFKENAIYRWQITNKGRGKHLGRGYSDHLPIFAYFSTKPFHFKPSSLISNETFPSELKRSKPSQGLFNLNTATEKELQSIKGIGPVLSARIVAGRPYNTVDDLIKVKGVGPKTLEKMRPYLTVGKN